MSAPRDMLYYYIQYHIWIKPLWSKTCTWIVGSMMNTKIDTNIGTGYKLAYEEFWLLLLHGPITRIGPISPNVELNTLGKVDKKNSHQMWLVDLFHGSLWSLRLWKCCLIVFVMLLWTIEWHRWTLLHNPPLCLLHA